MTINITMMLIDLKYFNGVDLISSTAYVLNGNGPLVGDIIKQINTTTFSVKTAHGTSECVLVRRIKNPGEMTITATHITLGTFNILEIHPDWVMHPNGSKFSWVVGASKVFGDTVGLVSP
jgi:hypothetical protein